MNGEKRPSRPAPLPTVQLRHELPDGSRHIDWMLGQDPQGHRPLICFRVDRPVSELREGQALPAVRIADHRPAYLEYEGPISGDRGSVCRLCQGWILTWKRPQGGYWEMEICWEGAPGGAIRQHLCLRQEDLDRWSVFLRPQTGLLR
ncbi:MAG: hypothetical protein JSV91_07825 [Phycisphaerales bacterium]|nr:MAG: hypothetical protein JSV91_07825 [Phycisphaerales bacterium]